jgi:hypothetical protein
LGVGIASAIPATVYGSGVALPKNPTQSTLTQQRVLTVVFTAVAAGTGIAGGVILMNKKGTESQKSAEKAPIRPRLTPYASPDRAGAILHFNF